MLIQYACKPEALEQRQNFDRNEMLKNIADEQFSQHIEHFQNSCNELENAIADFNVSPSLQSVEEMQLKWIQTAQDWELCAAYNFGEIMDAYIFNKIESRQANTSFIEAHIADTVTLTSSYIETLGSSSKGLAAIEYLLFSPDQNPITVLDSLTNDPRRIGYLEALNANLVEKSIELEAIWSNYYPTFINYEGNNVGGSVSELMNEMSSLLERIYISQLGAPLGKDDFSNLGQPEDTEAPLSEQSLEFIKLNIQSVEDAFFNEGNGLLGFDDYLNALGAKYNGDPLPEVVQAQFDIVNDALDAIPGTLEDAVVSNYALVEKAYIELKELIVLLKVDVASQLSITITFNDNDGD
ncbi:MAG: imelysin family protein [Flavobacteriales bacterium]|nr:imelysin family protein [Flavobacteriales bacterium]